MFLILISLLAIYVAWNLGGNDVANSMGTSVGSKAITLTQAIIIAGILEFTGAVIFGGKVSTTLATKITNPQLFLDTPQVFLTGMIAVLISCGLWLQIATIKGLPVASSHAVVGAIAGFSWVAVGKDGIAWNSIGLISLGWLITPLISGIVAICFYLVLAKNIFNTPESFSKLREWIPWLSVGLITIFGIIVFPTIWQQPSFNALPSNNLSLIVGGLSAIALSLYGWNQLEKSSENLLEKVMAKYQVISACFVAFAHGSNDVGNAIAPLAAIVYISQTNLVPSNSIPIPLWILALGGIGIVGGLAVQGKNVINTVGFDIIKIVPSTGFCAEIATATTILIASQIGLPVSTSHALVGSIVGIGLLNSNNTVRWDTIKSVILAWVITLPVAGILGGIIFSILKFFFL